MLIDHKHLGMYSVNTIYASRKCLALVHIFERKTSIQNLGQQKLKSIFVPICLVIMQYMYAPTLSTNYNVDSNIWLFAGNPKRCVLFL